MASNSDIAKKLGVNHSTVSRLRSGERKPSLGLFHRIVQVYKLDADAERSLLRASADPVKSARAFSRLFDRDLV